MNHVSLYKVLASNKFLDLLIYKRSFMGLTKELMVYLAH